YPGGAVRTGVVPAATPVSQRRYVPALRRPKSSEPPPEVSLAMFTESGPPVSVNVYRAVNAPPFSVFVSVRWASRRLVIVQVLSSPAARVMLPLAAQSPPITLV